LHREWPSRRADRAVAVNVDGYTHTFRSSIAPRPGRRRPTRAQPRRRGRVAVPVGGHGSLSLPATSPGRRRHRRHRGDEDAPSRSLRPAGARSPRCSRSATW
jgi:hypothetical protein